MHHALSAAAAAVVPGGRIERIRLRDCPELQLWLLSTDYPRCRLAPEAMQRLMAEPPYWAFCWASGQALARWLLDHPESVRGADVLDFGAGSGVVAIAAALAGARSVVACDSDPPARAAIAANAALNGVEIGVIGDLADIDRPVDLATVADVLYDRENLPLMAEIAARACRLLVADSRLREKPVASWETIGVCDSTTWPDLAESVEFNRVTLYRGRGAIDDPARGQ